MDSESKPNDARLKGLPHAADVLNVYTLYDSPRDLPGMFVLRRFEIGPAGMHATTDTWASPDIEQLRAIMHGMGLYCLPRHMNDEPQIVESWI
jgi:hypothetical protein